MKNILTTVFLGCMGSFCYGQVVEIPRMVSPVKAPREGCK